MKSIFYSIISSYDLKFETKLMNQSFIKNGIRLLLHDPKLLKYVFLFKGKNMFSAYLEYNLDRARKYYSTIKDTDISERKDLLNLLNKTVNDIIQKDSPTLESELITLYLLVRKLNPSIMVETGVQKGATSFFILSAMADNKQGKLYSIELPISEYVDDDGRIIISKTPPDKIGMFIPKNLRDRWELTLGDSKVELPKLLDKLSEIDIFFHDSNHTYEHMMFEFETSWSHIKKNGSIISDDISGNLAFTEFVKNHNVDFITPLKTPLLIDSHFGLLFKQ